MVKKAHQFFLKFQTYAAQPWFAYALSFFAIVDNFIFIFPIIPIVVGAILVVPRKWFSIAAWTIMGNTVGATLFSSFVSIFGISFVEKYVPHILHSKVWEMSKVWVEKYGLGALFLNSVLPTIDHPMITLLTLAGEPVYQIALVLLIAKSVKYFFICWVASNAPDLLHRLKIVTKD